MSEPKTVAIVGASADRSKFGNKSLRAHAKAGYRVFPVHPTAETIEGHRCFASVAAVPEKIDRVSMYVPPTVGVALLEEIAAAGVGELWLNPGAESFEAIEKAKSLGIRTVVGCSIVDLGYSPSQFP